MKGTPFTDTTEHYIEPDEVGEERARELYQYYRPPKEETKKDAIFLPYPDTVLQAHAQLAACRLDVQRAMIGLVDKDSSYFVAEATKTLDLEDNSRSEKPDDGLWYGSISMPKKGGLVEWTLSQNPKIGEDGTEIPAHLEILDMKKDDRWKDSKFVTSEPYFRYYCGVPLRTENNINIGALFLLDDRPRDSTSFARLKVLNTLAHNIMSHMKTVKDAHEKQRAIHMNMCMADFISPQHRFRSHHQHMPRLSRTDSTVYDANEPLTPPLSRQISPEQDASTLSSLGQISGLETPNPTPPLFTAKSAVLDDGVERRGQSAEQEVRSEASSPSSVKKDITEADHQRTFDRAAYLLRQALDLPQPGGGGVVLFDTNASADDSDLVLQRQPSSMDVKRGGFSLSREDSSVGLTDLIGHASTPNLPDLAYIGAIRERVVLAAASLDQPNGCPPKNFGRADPTYRVTLTPPELTRMCNRHSRGKLYNIPENVGTSLFDWEGSVPVAGRLSTDLYELVLLHRQFPDAKQVIFVPMFHANLNRWTCCFAYTNSRYRVFSYDMDYLATLSFCNAIRSEIVRLATVFADQQKSDFIGSVSHELRSPLHGILASIEFLQDTQCDAFQRSCIGTMDACAHTLLDTVAMILDYKKCTMKRRSSSNSARNSEANEPKMPTTTNIRNEPLFVTDQDCDVALITEEVVDGLATGHLAKHRTNVSFDDYASDINSTFGNVGTRPAMRRILNAVRPEVELTLNIEASSHSSGWTFSTQPGAIRRIVMNLFGNALKYTKHGYITVALKLLSSQSQRGEQAVKFPGDRPTIVKLTVTDTGQGMSPEYLRTKVFTPFAQENSKAAGTGLGLSIVRSIVGMLHGEIDIKSIVNVGTMVTVTLPLKKAIHGATGPSSSPPQLTSLGIQRKADSSVASLQNLPHPPQTAVYEPAMEHDSFGQTQGVVAVHSALVQYLTGWFDFPTLKTWDFDCPAKILIVDEIHLPTLLARRPEFLDTLSRQSIVILCANPARQSILSRDIQSSQVELICKPFGPYKLAGALCRALEKAVKVPTAPEYVQVVDSAASFKTQTDSTRSARSNSTESSASTGKGGESASTGTRRLLSTHYREVSASSDGGFPFHNSRIREMSPSSQKYGSLPSPPSSKSLMPTEELSAHLPTTRTPSVRSKSEAFEKQEVQPSHSSSLARPTPSSLSDRRPDYMPRSRNPRLLLVDDNRLNLDLLHTFVRRRGFDEELCMTAEDGAQAVDAFEAFAPDIIFMDLSMPIMDGLEATRNIRRIESSRRNADTGATAESHGTPAPLIRRPSSGKPVLVVALTGNAKGSDQSEAYDSGVDIYMTKPVSFKQIGKLLENWSEQNSP